MEQEIKSYTSGQGTGASSLKEFSRLFARSLRASKNIDGEVKDILKMIHDAEDLVRQHYGVEIRDQKVLEIGPGQIPRQLAYFAAKNDAIGVDLDVVPNGWEVGKYVTLLRRNGPKRFLKTVARKALGFDKQFRRELARQMGLSVLPDAPLKQMDATRMDFLSDSMDFVYSFSVFEHLPDPAAVLTEIKRVLKPGGITFNHLHLFTCDDGGHDLRIRKDVRNGMPYWPHLRPQHQAMVQAFAYINKIRIPQWKEIFSSVMPGCHFANDWDVGELPAALVELRAAGELSEYTDEELLTHNYIMVWQKPK
jgi:SAM-dependent methyltransferase